MALEAEKIGSKDLAYLCRSRVTETDPTDSSQKERGHKNDHDRVLVPYDETPIELAYPQD
jgi:hypothetical protein